MARLARVICVWTGVACAVWLLPASIHIVEWTAHGPVRVALLAPLWQLFAILVVTFAVAAAISALSVRGGGGAAIASAVNPLALMWLWAIPYLPWIPDRAPALLALAGPLRWGVLALALSGSIAALFRSARRAGGCRVRLPGRRAILAVSFAVYVGCGLWSAAEVGPGADEPHYLVITQSLLRDHDLAIENNHARRDYAEYFGGELRPDFLRRGLNEVIYSIHAPGLPALLVPAYAVGGYRGAVVMLCLFGALAALAIFDLATLLAGSAAAWLTWAAICLTVPFVPHSWLIFPEMPGALLTAWAALWLYAPLPSRARTWLWRGAAIGILPWLHTKFVVLLAAMLALLLLRLWRTPKAAIALVTPAIVSAALWIYSFYVLYGTFDPQIPYGDFPKLYVLYANIPRGVLGLLFDQKFGLLMYAPVYVIAIAGCWTMVRREELRWYGMALLATIIAFVASSTRMYMWWGGSSAPARFLVPILPLFGPMIAFAWQEFRSTAARTTAALLLMVSLAIAVTGVVSPQRFMLFSAPHGLANLAAAVEGPAPLSYLLPTFTEGDVWRPLALLVPWAIAAVVAVMAIVAVSRLWTTATGFTATSAGLIAFICTGAVLAGAPKPTAQRRSVALHGRLDLMRAYDGLALRAFDYAQCRPISDRQTLEMSALHLSRGAGELSEDAARFAGPFDLPPGRFAARIAFDPSAARESTGLVEVFLGDGTRIDVGPASSKAPTTFDLPIGAPVRLAVSDSVLASTARSADIVAESIVPRAARPPIDVRAIETMPGRPGGFVVYADEETYPEGGVFWTRSTQTGKVFVASGGAFTLVVTLHVGPVAGPVRLVVDGEDRSVTLTANETRRIEIPVPTTRTRLVPVVVQASGRFRPSDYDRQSTDHRWLGCQVRLETQ